MNVETLTREELKELLRSADTYNGCYNLWVSKHGRVFITRIPDGEEPVLWEMSNQDLYFSLGTWKEASGNVGEDAANNNKWVNYLFYRIKNGWEWENDDIISATS